MGHKIRDHDTYELVSRHIANRLLLIIRRAGVHELYLEHSA